MKAPISYRKVAGLVFAGAVIAGASAASGMSTPAAPPDGKSYSMTNFEITYPYDHPREDVGPDASTALVAFDLAWETGKYPGEVECVIQLAGSSGEIVGSLPFLQSSARDHISSPPLEVPVTSEPESAEGWCDRAGAAGGPGYVLQLINIDRNPKKANTGKAYENRVGISFRVLRTGNTPPGLRTCQVELTYSDGSSEMLEPFALQSVDGEKVMPMQIATDRADDVTDARANCREYEGS